MNIKTVTVFGANGGMGAQTAAIIAAFGGATVYMASRSEAKSKEGIEVAVASVRSNTIRSRLIPVAYDNISKALAESDWVLEAVAENMDVKNQINKLIAGHGKKGRLISTITSGLSISKFAESLREEDRKHYFGTHFFNPPYKMLLCETIPTKYSDKKVYREFTQYLQSVLLRMVVKTSDTPAFAANRVGFQFMNEAAQFAELYKHLGGASYIDHLLGRYTGRALAPLATLDFVGLDTHRAIVDNIHEHTNDDARETFKLPLFIGKLIARKKLGRKTKGGIYMRIMNEKGVAERRVYDIESDTYIPVPRYTFQPVAAAKEHIHKGDYSGGVQSIMKSKTQEAEIVRYFIARYISYSFSLAGVVTRGIADIDRAMAAGFGWMPPSGFVALLGGPREAAHLIKQSKLPAPPALFESKPESSLAQLPIDYRSLIKI